MSKMVKEQHLTRQTGVLSSTDETDIKRYLREVIRGTKEVEVSDL
jgi:hypothetical protein